MMKNSDFIYENFTLGKRGVTTVGSSHPHHLLLDLPEAVLSVGDLWCGGSLRSRCNHEVGFLAPPVGTISRDLQRACLLCRVDQSGSF
jgi:hypothetical protein